MTDRLPPHDIVAEEAVLGGIIIDPPAIHDVIHLQPEHFYRVGNGKIFQAMRELTERQVPIDYITLVDFLSANNEQAAYLAGLSNVVPTASQTRHYGEIVYRAAKRRELIRAAGEVATAAWDDDAELHAVFDKAQSSVLNAVDADGKEEATQANKGLKNLFDITAERYAVGGKVTGLTTGFIDVDKILEGLEPGNLYILAARPGVGKSSLEGCIRLNIARLGRNVLSFNLEMSELQSWQRLVAADTGLEFNRIRKGNMTPQEWTVFGQAIGRLSDLPMWIDDTPGLTPTQLHSKARKHQATHGLDLVTVDYLQLMASNSKYTNRVSQVGEISRSLKRLALSLDVPVLALSQLNRSLESRNDKRPMLADLRDSGDIEQDADVVMFVHREEYYRSADEREQFAGQAEIIIAKQRNGPIGEIELVWRKEFTRFANPAPQHYDEFEKFNSEF